MPGQNRFHLSIGSRFENIELVQVVLKDALENLGMGEDACQWVDVAVREAVANAIKHGNAMDPAKEVHVGLAVDGDEVVIEVLDQGPGFDPNALDDPRAPENLLKPNGRGIFYMRSFMDSIDYGPGPAGGTKVTLRKRLPGSTTNDPQEGSRRELSS